MCGIQLQVWSNEACPVCLQRMREADEVVPDQATDQTAKEVSLNNLSRRGPDSLKTIYLHPKSAGIQKLSLSASVLQMRETMVPQPLPLSPSTFSEDKKHYMCWNGEIYDAVDNPLAGEFSTSDTLLVAGLMESAIDQEAISKGDSSLAQRIGDALQSFYNAEYAFLVVTAEFICFGRDHWGRRSLLRWNCPDCPSFHILSTAETGMAYPQNSDKGNDIDKADADSSWKDIPPGIVYEIGLAVPSRRPAEAKIGRPNAPLTLCDIHLPDPRPVAPEGIPNSLWEASLVLEAYLSRAVAKRIDHAFGGQRSTAVLFSGGLDSAVVAALAAQHCQRTLHLYNVSFGDTFEKSADRKAALLTHETLQRSFPNKDIIFHDIVVSWEDICKNEDHIRTLLQPKTTLMDVNIATALWFASQGSAHEDAASDDRRPRVLLLGMGADEQLGGYGRHRKAFERGGWDELASELAMDQARFWERNLGRDDRIAADHGREARFPFLDTHVTTFLESLPLEDIVDFSLPPGQGDKRILRLIAMRLGLDHASGLVKRAIQFGSRISHLSDAKRFGSRRKAKGEAKVL